MEYAPDIEIFYYVEKSTRLLYEVQFFDQFVLVRPATPGFEDVLHKYSHVQFATEYEEYGGDAELLRETIRGENPYTLIVS